MPDISPDQMPIPRLLSLAFNKASGAIFKRLVNAGIEGLRPSHGNVMEHFTFEDDGLRLSELAARSSVTSQSMGQLVDELEELGYLERKPDPSDRRAKRIHLTEKGRQDSQLARDAVWEVDRALEALLGKRRLEDLRSTLAQVVKSPTL